MAYIKGYKFLNQFDAMTAKELCKLDKGLPVVNGTTTEAVEVLFTFFNNPNFWYIIQCEETNILGEASTFEVLYPEMNTDQ